MSQIEPPCKLRVVVSFTTSPVRLEKCLPMLNSIVNQTVNADMVVLNIPRVFDRTKQKYIFTKELTRRFSKKDSGLVLNVIPKDLGPSTKVVPVVDLLKKRGYDPDRTLIVYLDDDIRYPDTMIETYLRLTRKVRKEAPRPIVMCTAGFTLSKMGVIYKHMRQHMAPVDICEGYGSVCVSLDSFQSDFDSYIRKYTDPSSLECRLSDDLILSNYYHRRGIQIRVVNVPRRLSIVEMWESGSIMDYGNQEDALHNGANGTSTNNIKRYSEAIEVLKSNLDFYIIPFELK